MALVFKHKSVLNRLFCIKDFKISLIEKREISFAQKLYEKDTGKGAAVNDDASKESSELVKEDKKDTDALVETDSAEKPQNRSFIQKMKDKHEQTVKDATGVFIRPTTADKVSLMWSGKYQTREEIPELVHRNKQIAADNVARTVIFLWLMAVSFIYCLTLIKCGQRRLRTHIGRITDEQNRIWAERKAEKQRLMSEKK